MKDWHKTRMEHLDTHKKNTIQYNGHEKLKKHELSQDNKENKSQEMQAYV